MAWLPVRAGAPTVDRCGIAGSESVSMSIRPAPRREEITGLLLAGGMGRRMGGADKGLVEYGGRPLAARALERLAPQVGAVLVNANRNLAAWRAFGHPVIEDRIAGFAGPLAGLHAGLATCATPWLVTAPCDSPNLPADLVTRLANGIAVAGADLAVASAGGRWQPVFALLRRELADALEAYLAVGERKIDRWFAGLGHVVVEFDDANAFANINTAEELRDLGNPGG